MAEWAQIRYSRVRMIREYETKPPGEWVDITGIVPRPDINWYYDGSQFCDVATTPIPESMKEKAVRLAKSINVAELKATNAGKAQLLTILMLAELLNIRINDV